MLVKIVGSLLVLISGLAPMPVQAATSPTAAIAAPAAVSAAVKYIDKCKYDNETAHVERFRYTNLRLGKIYAQVCYQSISGANRTIIYAVKVTEANRFASTAIVRYIRLDVQNMLPDNPSTSVAKDFAANRWVYLETPLSCFGASCSLGISGDVDVPKRMRNVRFTTGFVAVG